jgi:hypothetical protein
VNVFSAVNTFAGHRAGINTVPNPTPGNSLGKWNSFYGVGAGQANIEGADNSFFGALTGLVNTGAANSFFGSQAGISNTSGILNTFVGWQAGFNNVSGNTNTFIGVGADFNSTNPIGSGNTLLGIGTKIDSGVNNGTAIGGRALVTQSNSLILGSINGVNNASADTNVGIGTTAPSQRLHVVGNGLFTGDLTVNGTLNATLPISANYIQNNPSAQQAASFNINGNGIVGGNFGIGTANPSHKVEAVTGTNSYIYVHTDGTRTLGTFTNSFENSGMIGTLSAHPFQIFTSNAGPVATFTAGGSASGRVGIGTSTPLGKLQVVTSDDTAPGNVPAWDSRHFVIGGPASAGGIGFSYDRTNNVGYIGALSPNISWRNLVLQSGGGNVGIGTTNPASNLHVNVPSSGGPINAFTVDVQSFQTPANAVNSYFFKLRDVGGGGNSAFMVRGDGNVGIGTDTPTQRLTVAGNASVSGTISGNGAGITNLGPNNLAADPNGPSTAGTPSTSVPFIIRYLTTSGTQVIYNHLTNPAPRNFLMLDAWVILTAGNGGSGPLWDLRSATNCGGSRFTNGDASGTFGQVIRVQHFNLRHFNASTDDLVLCFAGTQQMEINILATPMP